MTKNVISTILIFIIIIVIATPRLFSQEKLNQPNLRFYLSDDKSSYAGMVMVNQIWSRYIWNNPDKNGVEQYGDMDLALRRSRLIFYTYLMDKVFIYTQIGYDGQTYRSAKNPGVNLLNAQTEYIFIKNKLHIGFGLNTWNGISRYNNCKLLEFLVVDNPGFAYPVGGTFDQSGRQFGIYAKGRLNDFYYQLAIAKPFEVGTEYGTVNKTSERLNENLAVKGYFQWQFFDNEDHLFPYMTLNNLGRAKLFNIGTGFYYHPEAMVGIWNEKSEISDIFLASVDAFLDIPTSNNGAVTSYLSYNYNFFGRNYLRSMSKLNVSRMAADLALPQGVGNSEWEVGTGHIVRGELGYLLPGEGMKNRLQPYGAFTYKNFDALDEASIQFDAGINWLMQGHNIKWTLQYSNRPIYNLFNETNVVTDYKGQVILQTQVYF